MLSEYASRGGVHGICGYYAAVRAIERHFGREVLGIWKEG